ncbi:MAG TPA: hypothetical protein VH442_20580 [Micromonosporaceae bacterium]
MRRHLVDPDPRSARGASSPATNVDRFADSCVRIAAKRWPPELSDAMTDEWRAELAALSADASLTRLAKSWRAIVFAAGLVRIRSVTADGNARLAVPWRAQSAAFASVGTTAAGVIGVAAASGAAFAAVHDGYHRIEPHVTMAIGVATGVALVVMAAAAMVGVGVMSSRHWPARSANDERPGSAASRAIRGWPTVAALGAAMYGFLWLGNRVAVMPYMGWRDVAPAVGVWTASMAVTLAVARGYASAGARRNAWLAGAVGTIVSVDLAGAFGSLHAAATLGIGWTSAAAWSPLALVPGGSRALAGGADGHESAVLLGNASTMVGPLLLCSAFTVAYAIRAVAPSNVAANQSAVLLRAQRLRIGFAVVIALAVPPAVADPQRVTFAVFAFGWTLAFAAALGSRESALRPPTAIALGVVPPVAVLGAARIGMTGVYVPALLAVAVLATARWDGHARHAAAWIMFCGAAAVLGVPIAAALGAPDDLVRDAVGRIADNTAVFGFGFVGTAGGRLALAVALGVVASQWIRTPASPRAGIAQPNA